MKKKTQKVTFEIGDSCDILSIEWTRGKNMKKDDWFAIIDYILHEEMMSWKMK